MIDIHAHILPGIDDGANSFETSLRMAKMAVDCGVDRMIVTPHCNVEDLYENYYSDEQTKLLNDLENRLKEKHINLKLAPGMEVYATEDVPELIHQGKLITLNHSRYLLIEFNFHEDGVLIDYLLKEISRQGLHPIVAHPERYPYVQNNPSLVLEWIYQGCSLQVNKGSILGGFGQKAYSTSHYLLNQHLVAVVASDAHGVDRRTTYLSDAYRYIAFQYSEEYADMLLNENPSRILEDRGLINQRPISGRLRYI